MGSFRSLFSERRLFSAAILTALLVLLLRSRPLSNVSSLRSMAMPALNKFNVALLAKPYSNPAQTPLRDVNFETQERLITLMSDMVTKLPNSKEPKEHDLVYLASLLRQLNTINATHPEELLLSRVLFPFIKKQRYLPGDDKDLPSLPPVQSGSRGIVLAVGRGQARFAGG